MFEILDKKKVKIISRSKIFFHIMNVFHVIFKYLNMTFQNRIKVKASNKNSCIQRGLKKCCVFKTGNGKKNWQNGYAVPHLIPISH